MSLAEIRGTPLGTKLGVKTPVVTVKKTIIPYKMGTAVEASALLAGAFTTKTTASPKYVSVTPQITAAAKAAVTQSYKEKMFSLIRASPSTQKVVSLARAAAISADITKQGYELAPKGTKELLGVSRGQAADFATQINAFRGLQEQWSTKQAEYLATLAENQATLAKATTEGAIAKGQLTTLLGQYETLQQKYEALLNNPPSGNIMDIFKGIDLKQVALYGALFIGAIVLIPALIKRGKD